MLKKILILLLTLYLMTFCGYYRNYIYYSDVEKLRIGIKQSDEQIVSLPSDFGIELTDSNNIKSLTFATRVIQEIQSKSIPYTSYFYIDNIYFNYFLLTFINGELIYWGYINDYLRSENAHFRFIGLEFLPKSYNYR